MKIEQIINVLATVTLVEMMVAIGLGVPRGAVFSVASNGRLLIRAALANYVVVPALTLGLLLLFDASPMVAVGFLIPAVCPGAPFGPPFTALAKGNVATSVGLMVLLAASSAVVAPLMLSFLLPMMARGASLQIDVIKLVGTLVVGQFVPLCIGIYLSRRHMPLAQRLLKPMGRLSTLLNVTTLVVILAAQARMLAEIRLVGYFAMFALVAGSAGAGWLLGGSEGGNRKSLALTTAIRNVGISLVIVTGAFGGTPAVIAATAFGLFQTIAVALIALAWGRRTTTVLPQGAASA